VSKAGNPRLRTRLIQLPWPWVQHQPDSALTICFKARVAQNGGRLKKTTIVALACKLLVALRKYVNADVVMEGTILQQTNRGRRWLEPPYWQNGYVDLELLFAAKSGSIGSSQR
jgi:hypothetical protein